MPRPHDVKDSAQFVAVMRQLRQWADVSYRELERRAGAVGDVLPRATLSGALSRQELPREELLAAFVRACGADEATVLAWVKVRKRLAVELEQQSADVVSAAEEPSAARGLQTDPDPRSGSVDGAPDGADCAGEAAETDTAVGRAQAPVAGLEAREITVSPPSAVEALPVAPVAEAGTASLVVGLVQESSSTAPQAAGPSSKGRKVALRGFRRPGVVVAAAAAIVLLTASATAILRPGNNPGGPQESRTGAPAATVSPSSSPSAPAGGATSSAAVRKPIKDGPAPGGTREVSPPAPSKKKTTGPRQPEPGRSSWTAEPPPYEPSPYKPPTTSTPPPRGWQRWRSLPGGDLLGRHQRLCVIWASDL
ncbi:helix-turn-helix domain-containing protein [Streptomyces yanii]|uniref:helix-turn-helix domain-containing protein n=1 Tax=Streptomyces yanii TaxID=78510 RepID=UPI0033893F11